MLLSLLSVLFGMGDGSRNIDVFESDCNVLVVEVVEVPSGGT